MSALPTRDEVLRRLPPDATLDEVRYSLFMLEKAKLAREAIAKRDVYTHEEARRILLSRWRK
jgi:hypothetical protein